MKRVVFVIATACLVSAQLTLARPIGTQSSCTNKNDVPGDFVNQCVLAGGTEVRCSSGTPMCCVVDDKGTRCYDDVKDVKRAPKAKSGQPAPGKLAPPTPPTPPKNPPKKPGEPSAPKLR